MDSIDELGVGPHGRTQIRGKPDVGRRPGAAAIRAAADGQRASAQRLVDLPLVVAEPGGRHRRRGRRNGPCRPAVRCRVAQHPAGRPAVVDAERPLPGAGEHWPVDGLDGEGGAHGQRCRRRAPGLAAVGGAVDQQLGAVGRDDPPLTWRPKRHGRGLAGLQRGLVLARPRPPAVAAAQQHAQRLPAHEQPSVTFGRERQVDGLDRTGPRGQSRRRHGPSVTGIGAPLHDQRGPRPQAGT